VIFALANRSQYTKNPLPCEGFFVCSETTVLTAKTLPQNRNKKCSLKNRKEDKMEKNISDILPPDIKYNGHGTIEVPSWAFMPDEWSFAFLRGLKKVANSFTNQIVWEVGVGTGLNLLCLSQWCRPKNIYYSDFDSRCTRLAIKNLNRDNWSPLLGIWDLVFPTDSTQNPPKVDRIVACIPQVPNDGKRNLSYGDNIAHYYNPLEHRSSLNVYGLCLNHDLLNKVCLCYHGRKAKRTHLLSMHKEERKV
jgi:hypothetical protein